MAIVRGTTHTITYTMKVVDVANIGAAVMTVEQRKIHKITRNLDTATVDSDANTIAWKLTQAETLALAADVQARVKLTWMLQDGTRGAGSELIEEVLDTNVNEVMSL